MNSTIETLKRLKTKHLISKSGKTKFQGFTIQKTMLVALFFSIASMAHSQLNFGIKAGYNSSLSLSNMSSVTNGSYNLNSVKSEMWNNFHAGIFGRAFIGSFFIQPEVLYSINKKEYEITIQDANNQDVKLDKFLDISTVDIPLLLGLRVLNLDVINLRVFAGPKFRLLAGSALEYKNVTGGNFNPNNLVSDIKKAKVGLELGAGIDILPFVIEARYNIIDNMDETKLGDVKIANLPASTFTISLGFKLL